jgi:flagellar P-ring protein precursor FlgI
MKIRLISLLILASAALAAPQSVRLKELTSLEGVRDNQLLGYGIVVGLNGTGDRRQTIFTAQSLANMLQQMGVTVTPTLLLVRNTAAAMVTATLPPFAQPGSRIDATVSAMGDAASLQGGMLLMTSLRGIDGQVYSVAQGPVVTGGFIAGGAANKAVADGNAREFDPAAVASGGFYDRGSNCGSSESTIPDG